MAKLTAQQEQALNEVRLKNQAYREAKANARLELRKLVEERIAAHSLSQDEAVLKAFRLGVPKSRIGREGLSTTSPNTVYDILERMEAFELKSGVALVEDARDKFSWGFIHMVVATNKFLAWVEVDGEEFESEIAGFKHPGYAVLAQPGVAGKTAYSITEGDEPTHSNKTPGKYPELIEWIQANPLEPTKAEQD